MRTRIPHDKTLVPLLALGALLAAPLAFAQDLGAAVNARVGATVGAGGAATDLQAGAGVDANAAAQSAVPATPATPPAEAGVGATPATPATPPARSQRTWAELDVDASGQLSLDEAGALDSLAQVFAEADANADGQLAADEYKAFLATRASSEAGNGPESGDEAQGDPDEG